MRKNWLALISSAIVTFTAAVALASVTVTVNGTSYTIPQTNEKGWGTNVTTWIQAISSNTLQPTGGTFALTADLDFGGSFGVKSLYYKSRTANISATGNLRLANTDSIGWRNSGNSADLLLKPDADGILQYNSVDIPTISSTSTLTQKTIATGSNHVTAATGTVAQFNNSTGDLESSATTTTELGYLHGVTSGLQTQLNAKQSTTLTSAHLLVGNASNVATDVALSGDATISNAGAITIANSAISNSKMANMAAKTYKGNNTSSSAVPSDVTAADVLADISPLTTKGDVFVYGSSSTRLPVGGDSQVLTADSAQTLGVKWAAIPSSPSQSYELNNVGLRASISTSTIVVNLVQSDGSTDCSAGSPCKIGVRSTTATTGGFTEVSVTGAMSITAGTTASFGNQSGAGAIVYAYFIQDTTSEICLSYSVLDEATLVSATATPSTDPSKLYCSNVHTSRPARLLGRITATWSNPNWSSITEVTPVPLKRMMRSLTYSSAGTFTFTAPANVPQLTVCGHGGGGGGGGGNANATTASRFGGWGGAGAQSTCTVVSVTPGTAYTITVGSGGTHGTGGTTNGNGGSSGGSSSFGSLASFFGGVGGWAGSSSNTRTDTTFLFFEAGTGGGGAGGFGSDGATHGSVGGWSSTFAGGGGAGGSTGGGGGGAGDGAGGNGGNAGNGSAGTDGGGGGGGSSDSSGSGFDGGNGGTGKVVMKWLE